MLTSNFEWSFVWSPTFSQFTLKHKLRCWPVLFTVLSSNLLDAASIAPTPWSYFAFGTTVLFRYIRNAFLVSNCLLFQKFFDFLVHKLCSIARAKYSNRMSKFVLHTLNEFHQMSFHLTFRSHEIYETKTLIIIFKECKVPGASYWCLFNWSTHGMHHVAGFCCFANTFLKRQSMIFTVKTSVTHKIFIDRFDAFSLQKLLHVVDILVSYFHWKHSTRQIQLCVCVGVSGLDIILNNFSCPAPMKFHIFDCPISLSGHYTSPFQTREQELTKHSTCFFDVISFHRMTLFSSVLYHAPLSTVHFQLEHQFFGYHYRIRNLLVQAA